MLPSFFKSRIQNWLGVETKSSLSTPDPTLFELLGATPSVSGVVVTPRIAMTCAPVACAVNAISQAIGQLPVHVHQRNGDAKERAPDHPAYRLLHDEANDWTPAATFRSQLTRDALLYRHGGFAFINRVDGRPIELLRIDPERNPVTIDTLNGEPIYKVPDGTTTRTVSRNDILHIPSPSLSGQGLAHDAREAIGLTLALEQHANRLFANGARPSGVLSLKSNANADAIAKVRAAWLAAHGVGKQGGTAVLPADAEWTQLTLSSVDAQFLELRKFQIEEIARIFRVPPHQLFEMGRATFANSSQLGQEFLDFTLSHWITAWEGEIRLKLFAPDERATFFAEFHTDSFARADLQKRMDAYGKAIAARILNPNEVRAAENRPPYAGGDEFINPNVQAASLN